MPDNLKERVAELEAERDVLKRKLEILKAHGVEIVDAVAGGFEIYNEAIRERDMWKTKCETREFAYKQADAERKRYSEQIDELWAERDAMHGTLTAEQVRECAQVAYFDGYSDGSVSRGQHLEETDWQAIADELNVRAELGSKPPCTVYIVESHDSLMEGGYVEPTCYTSMEAAIRLAESLTYDDGDGVHYWARCKELKVVKRDATG